MQFSSTDLINLPVYTQSGQNLGRIVSFDFDIESHLVVNYHVSTGLIKGLWHQHLLVHRSQVVSISKDRMLVEDNVSKDVVSGLKKTKLVVGN
ncbi:MAG: hypothetical protein A2744_00865 [Candidatus Buchananbacteria bacterium RIFCSPHIGHO2_01_FULL_44_11]|uniref:PRC-barrel domain-containing protein n=1 Tax=Candidatus Buchananbacteria bacterium RIFCSPHIGHO2_01_FULL_44_11 TaxID=1797535 RepID=A0A1G1Y230_9BACT|nr:MAG: hypothetical protein A2744_00865 [Candidatus Buchananbacteria bacterium RIFCSPHIGHO2_01_FULL_44_11]